ncbi:acetyl-CoA carboxylase biotin carboxyl carrier protein [Bacteroidetes bacterium endosymbiont of Geopemphigus sp.]|uniref:acetyl-CoA carboxylase biotin carboxyl carrier protein n=1 Tax=Bacteroidetes bacterium endosymbiont of Geopemphigus sp. TaxID=2047937 RepID=UPI000CD0E4A9|nr:acetyl-CoA carboxylase biotin carboxyl carrier protein [Bacteroidetes bacterium endosymbiont of Geopemphigus sp.]
MDLKDIKALIQLISKLELKEFEYQSADVRIRIKNVISSVNDQRKEPLTVFDPPVSAKSTCDPEPTSHREGLPDEEFLSIRSPMIGTFYERPAPDKEVFVKLGDRVEAGQTVCVIEAMKLFNEIESEVSGRIVKVLVEDASPVEYDQLLFLVDPS